MNYFKEKNLRELLPKTSVKNSIITIAGKELIDFSSNDYLGLSRHPELIAQSQKISEEWGVGSGGSRLMSGDTSLHHQLESDIANFKGAEASLVFGCGYLANTGIIASLMKIDDVIFADKLCHASIIDGVRLSKCRFFRFNHNDINHLEELLKRHRSNYRNCLIVAESLYSMDGDIALIEELIWLKKRYSAHLMVDEAHSIGVIGADGEGLISRDMAKDVEIIIGTFGKALGSYGAFVACSEDIKKFLINNTRTFIYSTSLPPNVIAANIKAIEVVKKEPNLRKILQGASYEIRSGIRKRLNIDTKSQSHIIPIVVGSNEKALWLSSGLFEKGFYVKAICPPTVPEGASRIRLSVTVHHNYNIIQDLLRSLDELL
jgi:8-amino-7-oxononanoate synthase